MSGEREREESHFLGGGKKGGKMDVAEVPLAEREKPFPSKRNERDLGRPSLCSDELYLSPNI